MAALEKAQEGPVTLEEHLAKVEPKSEAVPWYLWNVQNLPNCYVSTRTIHEHDEILEAWELAPGQALTDAIRAFLEKQPEDAVLEMLEQAVLRAWRR
jgi:hypothetical protein